MGECNYHSFRRIKQRAKKTDSQVILEQDEEYALGGVNCYVVPEGETLDREKHFEAWFMELTDCCAC
jgi:hypothetical protein